MCVEHNQKSTAKASRSGITYYCCPSLKLTLKWFSITKVLNMELKIGSLSTGEKELNSQSESNRPGCLLRQTNHYSPRDFNKTRILQHNIKKCTIQSELTCHKKNQENVNSTHKKREMIYANPKMTQMLDLYYQTHLNSY